MKRCILSLALLAVSCAAWASPGNATVSPPAAKATNDEVIKMDMTPPPQCYLDTSQNFVGNSPAMQAAGLDYAPMFDVGLNAIVCNFKNDDASIINENLGFTAIATSPPQNFGGLDYFAGDSPNAINLGSIDVSPPAIQQFGAGGLTLHHDTDDPATATF